MKQFILALLLFTFNSANAQKVEIPDEYANFIGTKLFMEVPEGFEFDAFNSSIHNSENAMISCIHLDGDNFEQSILKITPDDELEEGIVRTDSDRFSKENLELIYKKELHHEQVVVQSLTVGNDNFSAFFIAHSPANNEDLIEKIKKALYSVLYNKDLKLDLNKDVDFTLELSKTPLSLYSISGDRAYYTKDGTEPFLPETGTKLSIRKFLYTSTSLPDLQSAAFSIIVNQVEQGYELLDAVDEKITIGNKQLAHLLKGKITKDNVEHEFCIIAMYVNGNGYVADGRIYTGAKMTIDEMEKLIKSIDFKE